MIVNSCNIHYHAHQVRLTARIHLHLSAITLGRFSRWHPVSSQNPWMCLQKNVSLCLFLEQCPACLVRLTWIVCEMRGRWPYSSCFVGCCFQDFFKRERNILVYFSPNFFFKCFVQVKVMLDHLRSLHQYSLLLDIVCFLLYLYEIFFFH